MPIPPTGRVLALDWGTTRIGVAMSDETQLIATPLETLTRRAGKRFPLKVFLDMVAREQPVGLVVGVPLGDDGLEGEPAIAAREMGRMCSARSKLPVEWIDESFSTTEAAAALRSAGATRERRRNETDAAAAATILQRWLDARRKPL